MLITGGFLIVTVIVLATPIAQVDITVKVRTGAAIEDVNVVASSETDEILVTWEGNVIPKKSPETS